MAIAPDAPDAQTSSPSLGERVLAALFGFSFLGVLAYAGLRERPILDPTQQIMLRVVAAISAASCAAIIPGFLHVTFRNWLRAGGALAVFSIVWFTNPPKAVAPQLNLEGVWVVDGSPESNLVCHQSDKNIDCSMNNSRYEQSLNGRFIDARTVRGQFERKALQDGCTTRTPFSIVMVNENALRLSWKIDAASCDLPAGFTSFDPEFVRRSQ